MAVIVKDAEPALLDHLRQLAEKSADWRVAILNGAQMEAVHQRMLRMRESEASVYELAHKSDMFAYFCRDADIVFLYPNDGRDRWPVLQSIATTLLPHLRPDNIEFEPLFSFYQLEQDAERLTALIRDKMQKQEPRTEEKRPNAEEAYVWKARTFAEALQKRALRETPLAAIVEDDYTVRQLARNVLRPRYDVLLAGDGQAALELYNNHAPDIVFLDIEIPHLNGLSVLKRLIDQDENACIVMFSAHSRREVLEHALKLGAKGFVTKPFTAEKLLQYAHHAARVKKTGSGL